MFRLIGSLFWLVFKLAFKVVSLGLKLLTLPLRLLAAVLRFFRWGRQGLMAGMVFFAAAMGVAWGLKEAAEQASRPARPEYEPVG